MAPQVERSLFGFIFRYSKRDQFLIVPLVLASMALYYMTLDLPKRIINEPNRARVFRARIRPRRSAVRIQAARVSRGYTFDCSTVSLEQLGICSR